MTNWLIFKNRPSQFNIFSHKIYIVILILSEYSNKLVVLQVMMTASSQIYWRKLHSVRSLVTPIAVPEVFDPSTLFNYKPKTQL
jgi:hypothetical protein